MEEQVARTAKSCYYQRIIPRATTLNIIGWLVLSTLVAQPCGAYWFGPPTCRDIEFDPRIQVCCSHHIHERPAEWRYVHCCVERMYNPVTHYCCVDSEARLRPALKVPFRYRGIRCYKPEPLDTSLTL